MKKRKTYYDFMILLGAGVLDTPTLQSGLRFA